MLMQPRLHVKPEHTYKINLQHTFIDSETQSTRFNNFTTHTNDTKYPPRTCETVIMDRPRYYPLVFFVIRSVWLWWLHTTITKRFQASKNVHHVHPSPEYHNTDGQPGCLHTGILFERNTATVSVYENEQARLQPCTELIELQCNIPARGSRRVHSQLWENTQSTRAAILWYFSFARSSIQLP